MHSLKDKIALVTGASRGIGLAISQNLIQAGAFVYGTSTSQAGADALQEKLGTQGKALVLDVNCQDSQSQVIDQILAEKSKIDILVNNAGITQDTLAMRMKTQQWSNVIDTNLSAVFYLSQLVIKPMMKAKQGVIINITSVIGAIGNMGQANYAASKAGVVAMSKTLAKELGSRGIRVNCIAPGFIQTDMTDKLNDEQKQAITAHIPLQSLGQVDDIAHAVNYLASDAAKYITGSVLHVNGGMHMND
jgi:3-oxoacyl-[acyl-carrier protein] reductase